MGSTQINLGDTMEVKMILPSELTVNPHHYSSTLLSGTRNTQPNQVHVSLPFEQIRRVYPLALKQEMFLDDSEERTLRCSSQQLLNRLWVRL